MTEAKAPSWGNILDTVPLSTVEYIVAHKGIFQRAPLPDIDKPLDHPDLWRAVLDRALLDYIKGPQETGLKAFVEVSAWLYDKEDTKDFGTVCAFSVLDPDTVQAVFEQCRYQGPKVKKENKKGKE